MNTSGGSTLDARSEATRRWTLAALVLALAALAFAYRALFTLGTRYDVKSGIEYWLFVPSDRAPAAVLALCAWLAYRRWSRLRELAPQSVPIPLVAAALGLAAVVHLWSIRVDADDLQAVSLMLNASGLVMLRFGLAGLRVMRVPIAFLVFCIPIPSPLLVSMLWQLRLWTADYTGWLLYLLGVPALVSGDQILRASETFQVVEGCSGLRSAETLTMLVVLLVDLFHRRGWHAALLIASAPIVAFALNGVRVLTLTLNPHSQVVAIHSLQGIAILLVGLLTVYALDGIVARLRRRRSVPGDRGSEARERARDAVRTRSTSPSPLATPAAASVALAVALATASYELWAPVWNEPRPGRTLTEAVDQALAPWSYEELEGDTYFHGRTYFRESVHRSYSVRGSQVEVFVGAADLRDRGTSIRSWVTALPGSGWTVRESRRIHLEPAGDVARQLVLEKGTERRLSRHRLIGVGGLLDETLRSFLGLDGSDFRRRQGQLALRLSTRLDARAPEARERAEQRIDEVHTALAPALERVRSAPGAN